jgi:hypothetical protein
MMKFLSAAFGNVACAAASFSAAARIALKHCVAPAGVIARRPSSNEYAR